MPLSSFISAINKNLLSLMPGIKVYGLTQAIQRNTETLPGVVDKTGEIKYVGFDDLQSAIIYHKNLSIAVTRSTKPGRGDDYGDPIFTYAVNMVVYLDHARACMTPDEMALFIQSNFPDAISKEPYRLIRVNITSVNLNSQQVLEAEYKGGDFQLPANKSLFQVNYNIETTFTKKCFAKCPEGTIK